jgi:hypothetical protein
MKSYTILVLLLSLFVHDALAAAKTEGEQMRCLVVNDQCHVDSLATRRGEVFLESLRQRVHVCSNLPNSMLPSQGTSIDIKDYLRWKDGTGPAMSYHRRKDARTKKHTDVCITDE